MNIDYFMTEAIKQAKIAYENNIVSLHAEVNFRRTNGTVVEKTTVGRIFFNEIFI